MAKATTGNNMQIEMKSTLITKAIPCSITLDLDSKSTGKIWARLASITMLGMTMEMKIISAQMAMMNGTGMKAQRHGNMMTVTLVLRQHSRVGTILARSRTALDYTLYNTGEI